MAQIAILSILVVIVLAKSLKVVSEQERLVHYRLGRLYRIAGPGILFLLPFMDKGIRVNLTEAVPGWQGLSQSELEQKIREYVAYRPV
ncbi:MAG TPA: SPFH domain-containing protein [Geobacteraceae bacterium]|nr:SPFH domain-containing protein [Geobacteraceae bacterium]